MPFSDELIQFTDITDRLRCALLAFRGIPGKRSTAPEGLVERFRILFICGTHIVVSMT